MEPTQAAAATKSLPIIDLASFDDSEESLARIAAAIGAACRDVGFFYVINHGVDKNLMAETFAQAQHFFALPSDQKHALDMETVGGNRGYCGFMKEILDQAVGADNKESFHVGLDLKADDPEILAGKPFRVLNAWPNLPAFRETMVAYYTACAALGARLHRAFAKDLQLAPDYFAPKFVRPMGALRILHYPPAREGLPTPPGAGEHTDYGNLTLLATDEVGGLEVRARSGEWIAPPAIAGSFIVNIGDCLMRWTNDVYVSTLHRVIHRSPKSRYSIAFFYDPEPDTLIETPPSCVPAGKTARYPPITVGNYLQKRLDDSFKGYKP